MQHRGLASSHFSRDQRDRGSGQDTIFQHRKRALVLFGPEEEIRIRQQRKRALLQTEVHIVDIKRAFHGALYYQTEPTSAREVWPFQGVTMTSPATEGNQMRPQPWIANTKA
jgi:hypothetical protein